MGFSWKDGLATVFVGAAAALYLLWVGGTTVAGLSGARALAVAIFGWGVGGCYTAKSQMEAMYGAGGRARPPLYYVVVVSVLGGLTLVAGIIAMASGGEAALGTLAAAMVALWALATIRHSTPRTTPETIRTAR
jgi:hypothetical protein